MSRLAYARRGAGDGPRVHSEAPAPCAGGTGAVAPACSALPNSRADPNSRCLDNFKRHFLAFKLGLDGLSVVGAFEAEAEETFGHFGAPGVEHGDEGRGVGLPGHGDAVLDFEADFLARELELAHGVAHERLDAEIFSDLDRKSVV